MSNTETKPAPKTTEFWLTLAVTILASVDLTGIAELVPDRYAQIAVAVTAGLYSIARGIAKSGVPNENAVVDLPVDTNVPPDEGDAGKP